MVETDWFQRTIMIVIVINAISIGLETWDAAMAAAGPALVLVDQICLAIFVLELMMKLVAKGWRFFLSGWNLFDFAIVAVSIAPMGQNLSELRALRILRALRLVSNAPSLRRVAEGFLRALPGMTSVFMLLSLIFYIASVMATKLFGGSHPEWFGSIGASAYTLFQIMTLESWSMGIVRPVMETHPYAWAFFLPFILLTTFAVLNLLIGLIVNAMQEGHWEEADKETEAYRVAVREELAYLHEHLDRIEARLEGRPPAEPDGPPRREEAPPR
ncbi:MAG: ion transporter [Pseudomonadota bacterium]